MKRGDTVKITETMGTAPARVVTGTVDGFSLDFDYVLIKQGGKIEQIFLADITDLSTVTSKVKKMKGTPSKIGVPSA